MKLSSIHLRRMSALRAPKQAKQLRELFQADHACERAHPEEARLYNRPLIHSASNVARIALADGSYPYIVMHEDEAVGMATAVPSVTLRSRATVIRGTKLDYWITPRFNLDSVHRTIARGLTAEGRRVATDANNALDSNLSMVERAALISSQETAGIPNTCVFSFIGDPASAANRGLAHVLQRHTDQSRFHVVGADRFDIEETAAQSVLYTARVSGADLRLVS